MRALILALALAACSTAPTELPPQQLPQRVGVDPLIAQRAAGVIFRAEGSDPAFVLQGYRDSSFRLTLDGGAREEFFPTSTNHQPAWPGTVYVATNERGGIRIEVRDRSCRDPASGDSFAKTVIVSIGGEDLMGCGGAL